MNEALLVMLPEKDELREVRIRRVLILLRRLRERRPCCMVSRCGRAGPGSAESTVEPVHLLDFYRKA